MQNKIVSGDRVIPAFAIFMRGIISGLIFSWFPAMISAGNQKMKPGSKRRIIMLATGMTGIAETCVDHQNTAGTMGSGTLEVFATPALLALVEKAAWELVQPELNAGETTVGTKVELRHTAATPVGMKVTAEVKLTEIDGRRLTFAAVVKDEAGEIGTGTHERFIVGAERFQQKANGKHSC